jgi:hypothetical protein
LIGATTKLGPCQVRIKTEHPCPHQAVMEIRSIPFCEPCAREQKAYFHLGKLTMQAQGLASDPELPKAYRLTTRERQNTWQKDGSSGTATN